MCALLGSHAIPFLVGCPACLRNFLNLFCELSCSPNQSLFINVTSISKVKGNLTVDGIDFFVTDTFGEGLYNSCKDVKFGTMNTRALEFVGAGAQNFKGDFWFQFAALCLSLPPFTPTYLVVYIQVQHGVKRSPTSPEYQSNIKHISVRAPLPLKLAFGVEFYPRLCNMVSEPEYSRIDLSEDEVTEEEEEATGICSDLPKEETAEKEEGGDDGEGDRRRRRRAQVERSWVQVSPLAFKWFAFIGQQADFGLPGSPYAINFQSRIPESSGMELMNVSIYSCGDTSLGCSCGDCPASPVCSDLEPPSPPKKDPCSIRIGSLKVKCIDFSLGILYIILVSALFGWALFNRTRERRISSSSMKPLLSYTDGGEMNNVHVQKDEMKVHEMDPQMTSEVQLSVLQGYMSRKYGTWVARNPTLVLCSSLAVVLILCFGLIRFQVETRPEKLWVGHGSKAAEEKHFFDSHLAPFYRIEQVDGIRANYSGALVSLTDICLKPLDEDCATQSVLQYFKMDPDNFDDYGGVEHAVYCFQHYTSSDTCMSAFKAPLDPSTVLGGFSGNNYSEASAFVVTYPVNNAVDETGNENGMAVAWEKAFIQLVKDELLPMVQSSNLTLSFSSESSIEEELKRESTADVVTILISYLVMFAYISVTLGDAPHLSTFYISSKTRYYVANVNSVSEPERGYQTSSKLHKVYLWLKLLSRVQGFVVLCSAHEVARMDLRLQWNDVLLALSGIVIVLLSVFGAVGFFSAIGVNTTTTSRRSIIIIHSSTTGTLVHLGNDGVVDAFQLLHLVLKLVRLSKLVRIQPPNCLLNGSFNLLLVIWAKLGTDLLILNGVPHVVGIVFQCILGLNFLLVVLILSLVLFGLLYHLSSLHFGLFSVS
ncbi:hypothetical protein TEA_021783 [Camellia sinensis var. sinensis]|uniref:Niemann-Pick C1 N-terminal domain-containing protein n=1 Tax=Camellia sinensis var. sinensis TaxID=542762 RepID=A0A4S4E9G8_CAMSN|nr:hypothetical protein TEA_021783 [Camellia sinensis var. sinensis]